MSITVWTDGLCSKWGFHDGDIFDDWKWDREEEDEKYSRVDDHTFMLRVILMEVVPRISNDLDLVRIHTIHNPLRTRSVDGKTVDWFDSTKEYELSPDSVEIEEDILLMHLDDLVDELYGGEES